MSGGYTLPLSSSLNPFTVTVIPLSSRGAQAKTEGVSFSATHVQSTTATDPQRLRGDFTTQNRVKVGKASQVGWRGSRILRLGNGFHKEKGEGAFKTSPNFWKIPNLGGGRRRGLERFGWFPKFYPVLSSEVSPNIMTISCHYQI